MKTQTRLRIVNAGAAILLIVALSGWTTCNTTAEQRPGNSFDGSVHWALNLAQPAADNFAADAQLYNVLGIQVYSDGRLPANMGRWSLQYWSPSLQKELQVIVRHNETTAQTARDEDSPPSSDGQPVPANWANSTVIFDAIAPHLSPGDRVTTLVAFNLSTYQNPVWGISFDGQENHYVSWDGSYLGNQP